MDAGGEIDLTGLKEQIEGTQKSIENLNKTLGKTGNTLTSIEHKEVGQRLHALSSSVNELFSAIANTKGIENSVGAIKSFTEAMEVLNKAMTATENASALFKTGFVQGEIGAASGMIQDLMNRLADGITKSSETMSKSSVSFVRNLQAEFNKIIKEAPPKIAKLDVFNAEQTLKDLDAVRAKSADLREYLRALGEEFKRVQSGSDTTIKNLPQEMGRAKKELQEAERTETALLESLNSSVVNQRNFNESLLRSTEYYARIKSFYDEIVSRMELMSRTGGDNKEIKKLENWKNALELLMKPYAEFISSAEKQTSAIDAATKALSTQVKYSKELENTNKELAEKRKYLSELEVSSKSTKTALELDRQRMEVVEQLVEKYKQLKEMSERKNVKQDALQPMLESVTELEEKLKQLQEQLNAIFKANPYAQKAVNASVIGSLESVMDKKGNISQQIKGADENAINLLNTFHKLVLEIGSATNLIAKMSQQSQRQAKIEQDKEQRLAQSMKARAQLEQRLAELQKQVSKGSESAIQAYLKQNLSISRLRRSLDGIKYAQEQCNHATLEGRQQYEKLEFEARKLQKTLDQIQGKQSILNKMFVKMKLGVGQISTAFGVMGGVFGAVNFIKSLYKITSEFQLQQKALGAIINNAREANVLFKQMQSLAVESPLKLMDLNKYAKQLAAFRIETNKIYDSLKMLGDISVGVGVDMDRLILAYGQVKAANYLRGQELRQFSEAGVNILGGLQKYYEETKNITMTINEIFDSVSKRKVLFEDVDAVLHRMTESGGTFFNMQLVQSQTLYGQYQKLGDMFQIEMNKIGSSTSGILLSGIKVLQFFIQNLRIFLDILLSIGAYKGITKLVASFQTGTLVSKEFTNALRLANVQLKNLVTFNLSKFIANMKSASAAAQALRRSLTGIGAAVAVFAITEIVSYYQKQKQSAKELSDELVELNKRYSDIQENEKLFKEKTAYKERIAVLQQLVDKAKEYNIQLEIAQNVNASNLEQVYNDALNQLKDFIGQVNYYKTVFSTDKTFKKDTKDAAEEYARLNAQWLLAQAAAKEAYKSFLVNSEYIPQEMKEFWEETIKMQEDYKDKSYEKEQENLQKYGYTSDAWGKEFARRINIISDYYKKTETLRAKGSGYGGSANPDAIFSTTKISYTFPDVNGKNNPLNQSSKNIDEYVRKEKKAFDELAKAIKTDLEENGENLSKWSKMSEEELLKNIPTSIKAWEDVFKSYGITEEDVIKRLWAEVTDVQPKIVFRAMLLYNNKETDLFTEDFNKDLKNLLGENGELEFDVKFNTQVYTDENEVKKQVATEDQIKDAHDRVRKALEGKNIVTGEAQEAWRKEKKAIEDEIKEYKKVESSTSSVIEKMMLMIRVNRKLGESFYSPTDALAVLEAQLDQIDKIGEKYQFTEKKTSHARSQSMKSEYQSMIDFVRELNREFDTLRKNFNEKDSAKWAGATNRILSSFEAKFGAMPAKFKKAFQNTLSSIDFTTKEGTVQAENIVKGLIDSAKDLTKKEKDELQRAWGEAVGQIKLEAELELKASEDERLKAQVQKMFDDYNLTIELDKLGVDADEVGKLFNIDTKDLLTLEQKLESMKEKFVGRNMEKEYRQFMRKIVEINDKANLEMAKKYVKYLREEYGERAKVELEYMRQRAEVYALPFDEGETMRILDNLQKETQKKLDEIDWKSFTSSDMYVELFEDLNRATVHSMEAMKEQLNMLKSSLSSLDPSNLKTIVDQIDKLDDELTKRDPFKVLTDSLRSWRDFKKSDKTESLINEILGTDGEIKMRDFRKTLNKALDEIQSDINRATKDKNIWDTITGAAKSRDEAKKWVSEHVPTIRGNDIYDIPSIKKELDKYEKLREETSRKIQAERAKELKSTTDAGDIELSFDEKEFVRLNKIVSELSNLYSSLSKIKEEGKEVSVVFQEWLTEQGISIEEVDLSTFEGELSSVEEILKKLIGDQNELENGKKHFDKISEAAIEAGNQLAEMSTNMKNAYTSINEYLESIGVATDVVGEAWKEFGNTMFDTIIRALQMIPQMVASIVSAETAINAAAGWIGLIAEAITLVMGLAKSLAGLHDSYQQAEIEKLQKSLDKLEKTAEDLSEAFESSYAEEELRQLDAALIRTRELAIATLEDMKEAEEAKKKSDQAVIDDYQNQIDNLNKEMQEGIENFYEALGGFGSAANMKSTVEEWTNAWYEAFKETGDGLSGLEDSFEEFFENIVKKHLMNNIMTKYFGEDFLASLDTILGTEGGVMGNLDALNDWINQYHDLAVQADEEMQAATQAIQGVTGIGGGLEGLQASLQGMTEETADILAAYLNSVRFYVADNNQLLQNLLNGLTIDNNSNPILQQLKIVAANTNAISSMFSDIYKGAGHDDGGAYIKVRMG